jgi:hypothetical protein
MTHIGAKPSEDGGGKWEAKARAIEGDATTAGEDENEATSETSGGSVTLDDVATGGGRTKVRCASLTAMDIIAAVPVEKCVETMDWVETGRETRDERAMAFGAVASRPVKISVDHGKKRGGIDKSLVVAMDSRWMERMETPVIVDEDETRRALRRAIREASFSTNSESCLFRLNEDALEALDCVENDLQKRYDVERESEGSKEFESTTKVGKLKDFMSLFPRPLETSFAMDEPSLLASPVTFLLSMAKKIKVLPWENEIKIDSSCKEYLKNLLFQGRIPEPSTKDPFQAVPTKIAPLICEDTAPRFMENVDPDSMDIALDSKLKTLTTPVEEHTLAVSNDFSSKAKAQMTKKLLNVDDRFVTKPMIVPKIDEEEEEDANVRTDRAMRDVIASVQAVKDRAPALSEWKVAIPNTLDTLARFQEEEHTAAATLFREAEMDNDDLDWTWDDMMDKNDEPRTTKEPPKSAPEAIPKPPTLSESLSLSKIEKHKDACLIDFVELDLDPEHTYVIKVLAERYGYISQILPLDIQRAIPRFQVGESTELAHAMKHFANESSSINRHLKNLLCCQSAANLIHVYGIHQAHILMRSYAKDEQDLSDIKSLVENNDVAVERGEFDDHPKLRMIRAYIADLIVTQSKMLIIFPDAMGILSIVRFISKLGTKAVQFDGKQEFKNLHEDDVEDFARAVTLATANVQVLIALEAHIAHEAFPLELFSTCVYYAPSPNALQDLHLLGSSRHAANRFVRVLAMKRGVSIPSEDPEPASSALRHSPHVENNQHAASVVRDEDPNVSPPVQFDGVPRHVVVLNVARQIIKVREQLFGQVERNLLDDGCDVILREFGIDVDACFTVGKQVHAVILIVPEYFVEGLPTQIELFSLVEDLMVAMAHSFVSGTMVFEGDLDFLNIAQTLDRRIHSDAAHMHFSIDLRYSLEDETASMLHEILQPQDGRFSEFSAPMPESRTIEEMELCDMFPLLNPISACALLADEFVCDELQRIGNLSSNTKAYLQRDGYLGCPLDVFGAEEPAKDVPPPYSPRGGAAQERRQVFTERPITEFYSPISKRPRLDEWELESLSLDSPTNTATPHRYQSLHRRNIDTPSPIVDFKTSPTSAPRSLLRSPPAASPRRAPPVNVGAVGGGRLWQPTRTSDGPSTSANTILEKHRQQPEPSLEEFNQMLESYRMPAPPERGRRNSTLDCFDSNRDLTQHRFTRISSSRTQQFPNTWK